MQNFRTHMQAFTPPSKKATVAKPPSAQPAQIFTAAPAAKPQGQPGATMTAAPAMPPMRAPATPPRAMPQRFAGQPGIYHPNAAANAAQAPQGQFAVPFNINVQQSPLRRAMERIAPAAPMQVIQPGMQTTTQAISGGDQPYEPNKTYVTEDGSVTVTDEYGNVISGEEQQANAARQRALRQQEEAARTRGLTDNGDGTYTDEAGRVWEMGPDGRMRTRVVTPQTPEEIAANAELPEEDDFAATEERERLLQETRDALPSQKREILAQIARAALGANMADALRGGYGGVSEAEQQALYGAGQSAIARARMDNLAAQRALTQDEAAAESEQSALEWDMFNSFGENQARAYTLAKANQTLEQQIADALEAGDTEKAAALAAEWNKNAQELEGLKNSSGAVTETADAPPEPEPEAPAAYDWANDEQAQEMLAEISAELSALFRNKNLDPGDVYGDDYFDWLRAYAAGALNTQDPKALAIAAALLGVPATPEEVRSKLASTDDLEDLEDELAPIALQLWMESGGEVV